MHYPSFIQSIAQWVLCYLFNLGLILAVPLTALSHAYTSSKVASRIATLLVRRIVPKTLGSREQINPRVSSQNQWVNAQPVRLYCPMNWSPNLKHQNITHLMWPFNTYKRSVHIWSFHVFISCGSILTIELGRKAMDLGLVCSKSCRQS